MRRLLLRIKAWAEKVIGTPGNPGKLRPCPVLRKARVDVVDATGAGESFNAGLLYGLTAGWPLERAVRMGTATGALAGPRVLRF